MGTIPKSEPGGEGINDSSAKERHGRPAGFDETHDQDQVDRHRVTGRGIRGEGVPVLGHACGFPARRIVSAPPKGVNNAAPVLYTASNTAGTGFVPTDVRQVRRYGVVWRKAAMRSAVWLGPNDIQVSEEAVPNPASGEVLLKVEAVGICGSELSGTARRMSRILLPGIV
jgi:hypothetical protein